jgi:hypothetical protein
MNGVVVVDGGAITSRERKRAIIEPLACARG